VVVPERTQQVELGTIEEIKVVDAKTKARNLKFARLRLDDEAAQLRHDVDQLVAGVARVIDQSVVPELLHRLLILVQNHQRQAEGSGGQQRWWMVAEVVLGQRQLHQVLGQRVVQHVHLHRRAISSSRAIMKY